MKWLLLPLVAVMFIPTAFAEVGQNYDTIINDDGSITWTSHPERIMDGTWKNYILENTEDKVIFNSNSVGSFIFDKNSCSYSIYENGFTSPETQIIPSVSAVATHNNGTWENMQVNEASCDVIVNPNQNGIIITSEKFLDMGTNDVVSSNGTTSVPMNQKFIQEIKIDVFSGIKETFYIYDNSNSGNQLGISQTIHVGESIVMGNEEIQISDFDGMSFDRDFIIENESEILQVAQNLNYDMDEGLNYLSSLNIIHDSSFFDNTYKVNLDYSDGNFIGYLEIDPTFTSSGTRVNHVGVANTASSCSTSGGASSGSPEIGVYSTSFSFGCYFLAYYWDISSISDSAIISDVDLEYDVTGVTNPRNCDFTSIEGTLSTDGFATAYPDIFGSDGTTTTYVSNDSACTTANSTQTVDLGTDADSDFQSDLADDEFGVGITYTDKSRGSSSHTTAIPTAELTVTYSLPSTPSEPTNLTTTTGVPVELDWDIPSSDGGSSITGYKVFRTNNEYTFTELPTNSANSAGIDFTNNQFYLRGDLINGGTDDESTNNVSVTVTNHLLENVIWDSSTASGGTISGNTFTATSSGWSDGIARSTQTINPSTGGGEMTCTKSYNYAMCGLSKDPFWSSGGWTFANGDYLMYHNEIYELGTGQQTFSSSSSSVYKVKMDSNGLVEYFVDGVSVGTSSVTASGDYYALAVPDQNGDYVTAQISTPVGSSTTGVIDTGIQDPVLTFTDSNLPDGTDDFSVGSWVKLDSGATNTKLLQLNDITFNVGATSASIVDTSSSNTIISATGLTDNTSTPQHYVFTRNNNDFTIYQNSVNEATATDTTSLGSNTGVDYTTHIDGMIDEYFINSDALTSTEVEMAYEKGLEPTQIATTGASVTEYDDNSVSGGLYYYTLKSSNSVGDSNFLTPFVSGLAGTPPDPPVISTAINSPNTAPLDITISISPDAVVGSGTLTGFELYRDGSLITTTGLVTTYVDTVSTPGSYEYSAKSVSTHGQSSLSNLSNISTPTAPATPNAPTATILDPDTTPLEIELSFSEPSNNGSSIVGYQIDMWDEINNSWQTITSNTGNTNLTATISSLIKDTDYKFRIAAINLAGTGSLSAESAIITTPDVPTAPAITVIPKSDTENEISWSPNYDGGSNLVSWDIALDGTVTNLSSSTTSYVHSGLVANSTHTYEVRGNNLLGNGAWSLSSSATTYPFNPNWISTSAGNIAYSIERDDTTLPEELTLTVLRDVSPTWNLSCEYRDTSQVLSKSNGTVVPLYGVSTYVDTQGFVDSETIYITCSDGVELFSATSHGNIENALSTGLVLFDSLGGFMGAPAVMLMVLAIFSMATPRNAPTVLIIGLAVVGIFGSIGLLYFDNAIWGLLLVCGALGIFGIKRFF